MPQVRFPFVRIQPFNLIGYACLLSLTLGLAFSSRAQSLDATPESNPTTTAEPAAMLAAQHSVVRWTGRLPAGSLDAGKSIQMHFAIYANASRGLALWSETQSVNIDADGRYSVLLGANTAEGLPQTLFPSGESRWVEARPTSSSSSASSETAASTRSLLTAVPYAYKSIDAETLAGRAATDYVTREDLKAASTAIVAPTPSLGIEPNLAGTGSTNYLPIWTNSTTFGNSALYQSGSFVGIGITSPSVTLDINGNETVRGSLYMPPSGTATSSTGYGSHSQQFGASTFSSSTETAVAQNFKLEALPVGNNTSSASANFSLLYGIGTAAPTPTGFSIAANGRVTFASGQTFPNTITGITANSPITGGGTSGALTIGLSNSALETILNPVYARLTAANNFTSSSTFAGPITGNATGSSYAIEGNTATGSGLQGNASSTNGVGVLGTATGSGGIGVFGQGSALSGIGTRYRSYGFGAGLWADTNLSYGSGLNVASIATADDTYASLLYNNSTGSDTLVVYNFNSATGAPAAQIGGYHGACYFDNGGSFSCDGTKSAVVPVDNNTRKVALYAVESPENWFEDYGSGQLSKGAVTVQIEPLFAQTVNVGMDYKVFLTPNGDCEGLYVTNKTATGFEVRELRGGKSAIAFDYKIIARRKGYEAVRLADKTEAINRSLKQLRLPGKAPQPAN